jgi:hypothetical protein
MRINLGHDYSTQGNRSYLDAADDIIGLPIHELMRITRVTDRIAPWPEDCPQERVPDFLYRIYALASQI